MATDKAVQNQKVFVSLGSVLDLQERYLRVVAQCETDYREGTKPHGNSYSVERKRAIEEVIDLLGLPINKQTVRT